MAVSVQMPKQGNTVEECLLIEWRVKEGDSVKQGDVLCVIETDKASFEVPSTAEGVVLRLLAKQGELVPVLTDILIVGEAGEKADAPAAANAAAAATSKTETKTAPKTQDAPKAAAAASVASAPAAASAAAAAAASAPVSPRGRNLAAKLGVEPAGIPGSGPGGRITSRDIQAAVDSGAVVKASPLAKQIMAETGQVPGAPSGIGGLCRARDLVTRCLHASAPEQPEAEPERIPYQGIRRIIGDRMRQSLAEHAQLTLNASADASGLMAMRKVYKEHAEAAGLPKISVNDMICWATARTLASFPEVNAIFDRSTGGIVRHSRVHLAVAVDTPRGLMVPVIGDAHRMTLADLSRRITQYAEDCRKGSINPDLLTGGTFTVSNLGGFGIESFTPILNAPQVGILGVSAVVDAPVRGPNGAVMLQPRLGLSLTIDHQAVDGAPGARFLQALGKEIENLPVTLALYGAC